MSLPENIAAVVNRLDSFGFDVGATRVSLYRAGLLIIVVVGVYVAGRIASIGVRRIFRRITPLDATERLLGEKLVGLIVWLVCILVGIDILGIDLTALTVFSGAFGLAIGFGLQKTFGNLLAGIILLLDRSIKPGDIITVNDGITNTVGQVKRIGMRAVSVTTRDKKEYLIPNENLMINQVENWSYSSREVRVKVPVSVAYGTDIDLIDRLLLEATGVSDRVLHTPPPTVWLNSLGENGMLFEIQIWIDDPEEGLDNVRSDVLKQVLRLFKEHEVRIPYPQRDLHVKESPVKEQRGKPAVRGGERKA